MRPCDHLSPFGDNAKAELGRYRPLFYNLYLAVNDLNVPARMSADAERPGSRNRITKCRSCCGNLKSSPASDGVGRLHARTILASALKLHGQGAFFRCRQQVEIEATC
jgi:hypothetical protein